MLNRRVLKTSWCEFRRRTARKCHSEASNSYEDCDITKLRNVGILAHVDAGKTTTTERMLYYAGVINSMGEVDRGNTVTDFTEEERQRGITISSAAVTFQWKNHFVNLIDTPGHIDFTAEVEHALQVMDGVVIILDGSAGVEAQTLTVCRQAEKHKIPKVFYVNKMDKPGSNFDMTLKSIRSKLNIDAVATQFPVHDKGILEGIVDIVSLEKLTFVPKGDRFNVSRSILTEKEDEHVWERAIEKRQILTDKLSGLDDTLANIVIEQDSLEKIDSQHLADALCRTTLQRKVAPVLLGSSYKNIGVQPLMDSILLYLPSPNHSYYSKYYTLFENNFSAKVFKVVHDNLRGPLTFMRIYSGTLDKDEKVTIIRLKSREKLGRLFTACGDTYKEISRAKAGHIVMTTALRNTHAGDVITTHSSIVKKLYDLKKGKNRANSHLLEVLVPEKNIEPVFFCTIESSSPSKQTVLENALEELQREDPSLKVIHDMENDQIVLGGMGELHITVIRDKIKRVYKLDTDLGEIRIVYKETIRKSVMDTFVSTHTIGKKQYSVTLTLSLVPNYKGDNPLLIDRSPQRPPSNTVLTGRLLKAVKNGVDAAMLCGPKLNFSVTNVGCKIHNVETGPDTPLTIITAAVTQSIKKLMEIAEPMLLEPVMRLEIVSAEEYSSAVIADLAKRRADILEIDVHGEEKIFACLVPLSELLSYSTALRTLASGRATFTMEFDHYRLMDPACEAKVVQRIRGFV